MQADNSHINSGIVTRQNESKTTSWWINITLGLLLCTILVMFFEYIGWLPKENVFTNYYWAAGLTAMVTFLFSSIAIIVNFKKIENSKSDLRKRVELLSLVFIIILWGAAFLIYLQVIPVGGFKDHIFSILLGTASGIFVKLLEKELELIISKEKGGLKHTTVVSVGMLIMSLLILGNNIFANPYIDLFAYASLSLAVAMIFIHISKYYDRLLLSDT